jgi:hypothetical protein
VHAYSLTRLTGRRKNADRSIVVATVEVNRTTFIIVVLSLAASVIPAVIVGILLGSNGAFALIVPAAFVAAGLILVDQRTRKGLQLRRYEAMWDKRRAKAARGTVYVCGEPLHVPQIVTMTPTVLDAPALIGDHEAIITREVARDPAATKVRVVE